MSQNFEQKLSALKENRQAKLEQLAAKEKEIKARVKEKMEANIIVFTKIQDELTKTAELIQKDFQNGEVIGVYTNSDATNPIDKNRYFINILTYTKEYPQQTWGVNAPGVFIEANIERGNLIITKRTSFESVEYIALEENIQISTVKVEYLKELMADIVFETLNNISSYLVIG